MQEKVVNPNKYCSQNKDTNNDHKNFHITSRFFSFLIIS